MTRIDSLMQESSTIINGEWEKYYKKPTRSPIIIEGVPYYPESDLIAQAQAVRDAWQQSIISSLCGK